MEIILTKIVSQLVYPLDFSLFLAVVAGVLFWRQWRRIGAALLAFAIVWLWLWSTPVVTDKIRESLERRYPEKRVEDVESADAIVVLGGALSVAAPPRLYPDLSPSADRVWEAARLFKAGKAPFVIVSGGRGIGPTDKMGPESEAMAAFLKDLGVPDSAILLESESLNTYENAVFTKRILDERGIKKVLLVTSALHMRRAEALFRKVGIPTVPVATDYEVLDPPPHNIVRWLPDASALEGATRAFKEYLGITVFWIRGR